MIPGRALRLAENPLAGVIDDQSIAALRKRNEERLREAIVGLGHRYVLAGTRKPNAFGYIPSLLDQPT